MSTKVKICGITNIEDAKAALNFGADALGFNFYKNSPRHISVAAAQTIVRQLPAKALMVGVFVNHSRGEIEAIARTVGLDTLQFHGDEDLSFCEGWKSWKVIKAIRMQPDTSPQMLEDYLSVADYLLLDNYESLSYGGTGNEVDSGLIAALASERILSRAFLAGGLTAGNVTTKIASFHPFGVDVASGVEASPGIKDHAALKQFILSVKQAG